MVRTLVWVMALGGPLPLLAQAAEERSYRVGVTSESGDIVTWLRPGPGDSLRHERTVLVDPRPPEIDGPHNITAAPDHQAYFVSVAHGTPWGSVWRFDAATHRVTGVAEVGSYPTTIAPTPDGEFVFVANSDFFGDRPRVNPVSIIHVPTMRTLTNLATCDMPHGVRSNRAGTTVWVSCMHSDELVAIDVATLAITHRIRLGSGSPDAGHATHAPAARCAPTFVALSPDDRRLYVACNTAASMQVWDAATHRLLATVPTGTGAYNVEASRDGRFVIVTNKSDQSVSVIDAVTLREVRRIPTTKRIVHGIAFAPGGRLAYISQESVGADSGAVDVLDLDRMAVTSSFALPAQPTGITILRVP